ncbi:MAG TPA: hypothetical protein VJT71_09780 [Pyrinomonadaceae bacterium]|nr:hypothetical protein [Pyrinomonadaceae bacterium]
MFSRSMNSKKLLPVGLICLAAANLWHWFAQRQHFSDRWSDLLFGFLMGVGIGVLLLVIFRGRRNKGSTLQT